jgi:hypothetical protein
VQESVVVNPTVLADPPAAPESEQPSQPVTGPAPAPNGSGPAGPGEASAPGAASAPEPVRACANCGAALDDGQDWCLQCGAAVPGSLDAGGPGWRTATTVLAITAVLVLGAAAAAYAALTQPSSHTIVPRVVAVVPAAPVTTPGTASTPGATPTPSTPGTPTTINPLPGTAAPPKIPLTAPTPKSSGTPTLAPTGTPDTNTGSGKSGTGSTPTTTPKSSGGTTTTEQQQTPILLDTNAASTYNPYGYPASNFGDPSLAIDGEAATGWTAQVNPAVAPKMAEGLAIDLKTGQRVGALKLISSTPGMTVQVYGANGATLPASIVDPAWTALSPSLDAKKRTTHITLRDSGKAFRFFALWISQAPQSSVGTPSAPGHVSVNELELFAAKGP